MSNSRLTDKILILKARLGDKEAFTTLYNKYINRIYRFIYYKTGSKELAEDLVSQSFLKLWEMIVGGGQIKVLQALLYRIARNLVVDYYRSKQSTEVPLEYDQDAHLYDMEPRLHTKIDTHLLRQTISKLKDEYKEIIVLRYVEELSIGEIAKILDKSPGNVRTICHRAIAELKEATKDYE